MVNLCGYKYTWRSFLLLLCALTISSKSFGETLTTGNILNNSTFGTGSTTTTTGWSTSGNDGIHTHGAWNGFPYQTGMDDSGGVLAFEGHEEDNVYQDVDLVGDGHLTQPEINQGFTSTMGADVWFWNNIENTLTLKQTVTGADGSVSTQVREITGTSTTDGNIFKNYTNVYTQGSNTQTDITIRAELFNETAGTAYDNSHRGPDVDNVTLNVTYTYIPPINEDTQEVIDDIDQDIIDIVEDIPDDFDWGTDDIYFEEEYIVVEDEFTFDDSFYFEDIETVYIDELPPIEEFDMESFEQIPEVEMVFFEDEYMVEAPITEEVFTEEFEEDFTEFLEETGMEEEFIEFLEEEGITAEEFFEEITEEEFNDELTEESFEEFEEPMEEVATNEESVPEVIEEKEEAMEEPKSTEAEPIEEEKEIANNESTEESSPEEDEPSSESTEDSEVQSEDSGEEDSVQPEDGGEVDSKDGAVTDVAKVESKLKKNLKAIAKQIAKVTKETTQNLSKEDLFFKNNTLDAYNKTQFYKSKDIYNNQNLDLFNQVDLSVYNKEIYGNVTLAKYSQNDPVEVHRVQLLEARNKTNKLKLELQAIKNGG